MSNFLHSKRKKESEEHWMSMSDLMAGLLMVFILIAITYMHSASLDKQEAVKQQEIAEKQRDKIKEIAIMAEKQRDKIKRIAISYQKNKKAIFDALMTEFEADLPRWNAEINRESLTFNFKSPDVLFTTGSAAIRPRFQEILDSFFPRYMKVTANFIGSVEEIRIEGHTSSRWKQETSETEAYFLNMKLSQDRTRSVLEYVYDLSYDIVSKKWVKEHIAAVGYSSAKLITTNGVEDADKSRRVSFRVITNSETQMLKILSE